jgi:CofD-related protein of GAK system
MSAGNAVHVTIARAARIPDPLRCARFLRAPELGPKVLFLSGGSALRETCRELKRYTHNSVHLITPFDSGGSSAHLRAAFGMLSVGDLRNRLMALADESARGNPEIYALFSHRLALDADVPELGGQLERMVQGEHRLIAAVPEPMRQLVRTYLRLFAEKRPPSFDLRGASLGNLILAGGYLANDRDIDSVVHLFSRLVEVRGSVRPTTTAHAHLAADLRDGSTVVGQHRLTGKASPPLSSPIAKLFLVRDLVHAERCEVDAPASTLRAIEEAELICFPIGSFYSSVVANVLPRGVGRAIAAARCPKLYVPSLGRDPEQLGHQLGDCVRALRSCVEADGGDPMRALDLIAIDSGHGQYAHGLQLDPPANAAVQVIDCELAERADPARVSPARLAQLLVSLC